MAWEEQWRAFLNLRAKKHVPLPFLSSPVSCLPLPVSPQFWGSSCPTPARLQRCWSQPRAQTAVAGEFPLPMPVPLRCLGSLGAGVERGNLPVLYSPFGAGHKLPLHQGAAGTPAAAGGGREKVSHWSEMI